MAYKFFRVAWPDPSAAEAELNAFLRGHRVMKVRQHLIDAGEDSFWTFCVEYVEAREEPERSAGRTGKPRVDYQERLEPDDFQAYLKLRELRKELAAVDSSPVYLVFTNEQLAQIASTKARTKADLEKIEGIGRARLEKYADRLIGFLDTLWGVTDATGRKSV